MIEEDIDVVELYKVVIALSRLVIKIEGMTNDNTNEFFDIHAMKDISQLKNYLEKHGEN